MNVLHYLIDFAPVPLGIILFCIIKSVKLSKASIRIYGPEPQRQARIPKADKGRGLQSWISKHNGQETATHPIQIALAYRSGIAHAPVLWKGNVSESEKAREGAFRKFVSDTLIINGIKLKNGSHAKAGICKLGAADIRNIDSSLRLASDGKPDSLCVLCSGKKEILPKLLEYGRISGMLLWYALESKLSILSFKPSDLSQ